MSNVAPHVIVQSAAGPRSNPDERVACDGYYDLPVTLPAYIAIVPDGSVAAQTQADALRLELRRVIMGMPGARFETTSLPCGQCPAYKPHFDCTAMDRARSKNVLVFIGGGNGTGVPASPDVVWQPGTEPIVLLPSGSPTPTLPWVGPTINAGFWLKSATEYVPRVLAAAGLTSPDARVFISYRREESGPIAEQLFDALSRRNFDVFLDRFRIEVGADFQQRILRELAHKSMSVFLETQTIASAKWTRYEIAVAKSSRIGILAVHLPGGQFIPDIDASRRVSVPLTKRVLGKAALRTVVDRIVTDHDRSLIRRRLLLRQNMQRALRLVGVHRQSVKDGAILVQPTPSPSKQYVVWLPSRPAELSDFHVAATNASSSIPTIVGPAAHAVGDDRTRMRWLSATAGVHSFDEGHMLQVARAIKAGTL